MAAVASAAAVKAARLEFSLVAVVDRCGDGVRARRWLVRGRYWLTCSDNFLISAKETGQNLASHFLKTAKETGQILHCVS